MSSRAGKAVGPSLCVLRDLIWARPEWVWTEHIFLVRKKIVCSCFWYNRYNMGYFFSSFPLLISLTGFPFLSCPLKMLPDCLTPLTNDDL